MAEVADGRIVVTGAQNRALTYLAPDLTPHSMFLIDDFTSSMLLPFGPDLVDEARPWYPFRELDVSVEAYDRHTGRKLFENVPLPDGSKVLAGGRYLYVLLNPDIPPWRIAKYELLP